MDLQDAFLSEYGTLSSTPSPVNRMMAAFAVDFRDGCDINLGVGYVNERTIPDDRFQEAFEYVLSHPSEHRLALNYGGPRGSQNLIDAIHAFHINYRIGEVTEDILATKETLIGSSGATSILDALADVLKPGIVLTSDPMYYIYCNALERKGFEVVTVPEDTDGIDPAALEAKIAALGDRCEDVAFIYVVTVNNPSATILSNDRRERLVGVAKRLSTKLGRKVPLILDKAYEFLIHDPAVPAPVSSFLFDDLGVVYEIGTLSKILAPALRVGYLMGPGGPLVQALIQRTSDVGFSAPLINQEIATYLINHHVAEQRENVNRGYREKAAQTRQWIDERLGTYLSSYSGGQASFYFYLTFNAIETTENSPFFHFLTRTTGDPEIDTTPCDMDKTDVLSMPPTKHPRVVYIPGEHCVHPQGDMAKTGRRQLRISYGFEELDRIGEALAIMAQAAAYATGR